MGPLRGPKREGPTKAHKSQQATCCHAAFPVTKPSLVSYKKNKKPPHLSPALWVFWVPKLPLTASRQRNLPWWVPPLPAEFSCCLRCQPPRGPGKDSSAQYATRCSLIPMTRVVQVTVAPGTASRGNGSSCPHLTGQLTALLWEESWFLNLPPPLPLRQRRSSGSLGAALICPGVSCRSSSA